MNIKRLLSAVSLLTVTVPTSLNVVACGTNEPLAKTSLNEVIKVREVEGSVAVDSNALLAEVARLNPDLIVADVKVTSFTKATETASGAANITAKPNTNYTGVAAIQITPLPKIDLSSVITVKQVEGETANTAETVLEEVGRLNPSVAITDIEIIDFKAATVISDGSAKIIAKEDTKYTGEVDIIVTALPKIDLSSIITFREIDSAIANTAETVLEEVGRLNPNLVVDDVEIINFKAASETINGSAKIIAKENTRYTGEVDIIVTTLPKIDLNEIINQTEVDSAIANTADAVLKEIGRLNPNLTITDVEITDFKEATEITVGSAIITAKQNTKYTGRVGITISKLAKLSLSDVIKVTEINSSNANDSDSILIELGRLNPNLIISNVEITDFKAATEAETGSAKVVAKPNTNYLGEVTITITPLQTSEDINNILKEKEVASVTEDNIIEEVLKNNSGSGLTKNELEVTSFKAATLDQAGSAIISAKAESKFTGSVDIIIVGLNDSDYYNKLIEGLKNAETKSQEKLDLWIKFFNYKHYQTKAMVEKKLITVELTWEDKNEFLMWILYTFFVNVQNELNDLGVVRDYNAYTFNPEEIECSLDTENKIASLSGTFYLISWDDTKVLTHIVDNWQIPYVVN